MIVIDFMHGHIQQAIALAKINYENERKLGFDLPPVDSFPDMSEFADNGLGVAAFDGDVMIGYLCCVSPFENVFGSTGVTGIFSPMHANAAMEENRSKIYAEMYQAAGEKWVRAGAANHAVCLYAHDLEGQRQFVKYGFGMRSVDAVRPMREIPCSSCGAIKFRELSMEEYRRVLPLEAKLRRHMYKSPTFMCRPLITQEQFDKENSEENNRYFAAFDRERIIAFLKICGLGETFICSTKDMKNICGAYCVEEYRGKLIYQNLVNHVIHTLKKEGYKRLGVDFESINPVAWGFWTKYFSPYTYGFMRRIDEFAFRNHI